MHGDVAIAGAGLLVGFVIGLTGMGGGALLTPILVLIFHVSPVAAISSDVVASFVLKPFGGGVHLRRGTVDLGLVRWLSLGSVPSAFGGAYLIARVASAGLEDRIEEILGAVLLVAAAAMLLKVALDARRRRAGAEPAEGRIAIRPLPTLLVGVVGGLVVGMTSVGSGSLMIVALSLLYPTIAPRVLVGTDLVQAIPLVGAAALGHLAFGQLSLAVTGSVLLGAIPGVVAGAFVSARAGDRALRPVLVVVLAASGGKLLHASNAALLVTVAGAIVAAGATLFAGRRRASAEIAEG